MTRQSKSFYLCLPQRCTCATPWHNFSCNRDLIMSHYISIKPQRVTIYPDDMLDGLTDVWVWVLVTVTHEFLIERDVSIICFESGSKYWGIYRCWAKFIGCCLLIELRNCGLIKKLCEHDWTKYSNIRSRCFGWTFLPYLPRIKQNMCFELWERRPFDSHE